MIYKRDIPEKDLILYKSILESFQSKIVDVYSINTNTLPGLLIVGYTYNGQSTKAHQYLCIHENDIRDYKLNIILN
jgi:hypothetical protein